MTVGRLILGRKLVWDVSRLRLLFCGWCLSPVVIWVTLLQSLNWQRIFDLWPLTSQGHFSPHNRSSRNIFLSVLDQIVKQSVQPIWHHANTHVESNRCAEMHWITSYMICNTAVTPFDFTLIHFSQMKTIWQKNKQNTDTPLFIFLSAANPLAPVKSHSHKPSLKILLLCFLVLLSSCISLFKANTFFLLEQK